jgi:iron complex transport system substrate-binding protein
MKKDVLMGLAFILFLFGILTACGNTQAVGDYNISHSLTYSHSMVTDYAKGFSVDYYEGGYALIAVSDGSRFLVVPENGEVPQDLSEDICVLQQPVSDIYLAASAVMDMFCAVDAIDAISLSGTAVDSWHIDEAREAMENGSIEYAGKYSAPDYEMIVEKGCRLSIQSTMIEHVPEVKEQLELLGIPVLVDRSSYEEHPLGRMEWIKLYGVLTGQEKTAVAAFEQQEKIFEDALAQEALGKTVAYFYVTSNGSVNVRKPGDYISKMIALVGGTYILEDSGEDSAAGTMNLQMEEFYDKAKDADYLIYSSSIEGELCSVDELLDKSPLFADFKAVQEKNVWCTTEDLYQSSMELGTAMADIHTMLTMEDAEDEELTYLFRLE